MRKTWAIVRRELIAYFSSPLAKVTSRFISHITSKPVQRDINNDLLKNIYEDLLAKFVAFVFTHAKFTQIAQFRDTRLLQMPALALR